MTMHTLRLMMAILAIGWVTPAWAAKLYIYKAADGTVEITDRKRPPDGYRLVHASARVEGLGAIAAGRAHPPIRSIPRIDPEDRRSYEQIIVEEAGRHHVSEALAKAVVLAESGFNPRAVSSKGAQGLMQLMPDTAARYGVSDSFDPRENVGGGVRYLRDLLRQFGEVRLAVAAYNAGEGAVLRHRGIPPYAETREYVQKVLGFKRRFESVARKPYRQTVTVAQRSL